MPLVQVANSLHTDVAYLWLLTFYDPDNNMVLRAVSNLEPVTSRGQRYEAFPFDVTLPPDDGQRIQDLQIAFPNVGRELMQLVREFRPSTPPLVKLELVLSDAPDTVEKTIDFLRVAGADYDALNITFTLAANNTFGRKTCLNTYNQYEFPGLFYTLGAGQALPSQPEVPKRYVDAILRSGDGGADSVIFTDGHISGWNSLKYPAPYGEYVNGTLTDLDGWGVAACAFVQDNANNDLIIIFVTQNDIDPNLRFNVKVEFNGFSFTLDTATATSDVVHLVDGRNRREIYWRLNAYPGNVTAKIGEVYTVRMSPA